MTALVLLLLAADPVPQENCAELLDAGVPAPVMRIAPGTVVDQPLYVMTPARTCYLGAELQTCQADEKGALKGWQMLAIGAGGMGVVAGIVFGVLAASGHVK